LFRSRGGSEHDKGLTLNGRSVLRRRVSNALPAGKPTDEVKTKFGWLSADG